jgi:hypothetical protein
MTVKNIISGNLMIVLAASLAFTSCQKMSKPALGDYTKDANPPGGPLKFYAAFDGSSTDPLMNGVDSIRANFPGSNTGTFTDGISGKAYKGSETAIAKYAAPNDWGKSTSFTIAFWIKKTPQAAGKGTNFVFSLDAKDYSWTNTKLFLEFEDWSTLTKGNGKFYVMDQWVEYINDNGMPNVLNGSWHHLAFTYNGSSSTIILYIDGTAFRTNTIGSLGPINFGGFDSFTIGGPNAYTHEKNTWMSNFDGSIDQFRLYNTVLSAAEVGSLFTNKQ